MSLSQALASLSEFAFPLRCPSCGDAVMGGAHAGDAALCGPCWGRLRLPAQPACTACQQPLTSGTLTEQRLCDACASEGPGHDGIAAATIYGPVSRDMVLALKHAGRFALAGPMGRFMATRFAASGVASPVDPLVMPVPLHPTRLWKRGYNQSALLGKSFAERKRWDFIPDGLCRVKRTPSLDGLGREDRRLALLGAIGVNARAADRWVGREVVLIDDVVTSGATVSACVDALKSAGAGRVIVVCFARAVSHGRHDVD